MIAVRLYEFDLLSGTGTTIELDTSLFVLHGLLFPEMSRELILWHSMNPPSTFATGGHCCFHNPPQDL